MINITISAPSRQKLIVALGNEIERQKKLVEEENEEYKNYEFINKYGEWECSKHIFNLYFQNAKTIKALDYNFGNVDYYITTTGYNYDIIWRVRK